VIGFTEEVPIEKLMKIGKEYKIPVIADLGSGCMVDLKKYGVHGEPTVQEVVKTGADIVTFSGDKLLGVPRRDNHRQRKVHSEDFRKTPCSGP